MLGVGIGALRLNFRRPINRAVATVCFLSVLIFAAQLVAKHQGALYLVDRTCNPLPWIRLKFALIGLLSPLMVWVCYYLVSGRYSSRRNLLIKLSPWIILSGFLFWFPFTEGFKPDDSLPGNIQQGPLYYLYFFPMLAGQLAVCVSAILVAPHLSGVRKLEFRFITIALGYPLSRSCARFGRKQYWHDRSAKSCGACVPCLFRRASLLAAGWDDETYGIDLSRYKRFDELPTDVLALCAFVRRDHTSAEIERGLLANGSLTIRELPAYRDVVIRMREEVSQWMKQNGTPLLCKLARI